MKDAQAELNEEAALLKQAFAKPKDSPKKDGAAAGDGPSTSGRESAEPDEMVSGPALLFGWQSVLGIDRSRHH